MSFKIVSIDRTSPETVMVKVRMDAKEWAKIKKQGQLGQLYGVDISNEAYRTHGVRAHNPTVQDSDRASGGVKWVKLWYADTVWGTEPSNVVNVDFQLRRRQVGPILFHPTMREVTIEDSSNPPCEVIRVDFRAKRRVA